jgi:hypothetical protein
MITVYVDTAQEGSICDYDRSYQPSAARSQKMVPHRGRQTGKPGRRELTVIPPYILPYEVRSELVEGSATVRKTGGEIQGALFPRHRHLPPLSRGKSVPHVSGTFCHLCFRTHKNSEATQRRGFLRFRG